MSDLSKQDALDAAAMTSAQLAGSAMTPSAHFNRQVKQFEENVSSFGRKIDDITFDGLCKKTQDPLAAINVWKSFQEINLQVLHLEFDLLTLKRQVLGL